MVHHSCYLSNFRGRLIAFFCPGPQLADSRGPEALGPQGLPDLQVAPEHHFQAKAFQLGRAGHGSVRGGYGETGLCLCFSRLRFRIWAVMELQRWWNYVRNCRMIINLLSHLLPIIPKINIHLYQDLSSMANVLPTEEGMLVSGITGTMYSSYLGCCANQINLASLSTPDTRPRYQTCGAHPCTNLAQEDDLSCCALCGNFVPEKWPGKSKTMIAGETSSYGATGTRISSKQTGQIKPHHFIHHHPTSFHHHHPSSHKFKS